MTSSSIWPLGATLADARTGDSLGGRRILLWGAVILGATLAAFVAYRVAEMTLVLGSEAGRWTYVYLQGYQPRFARVFVRAALVCGGLLLAPAGIVRRYEWGMVIAWLIAAFWVQDAIRQETRYTFEQIVLSDGANSFYQPTLRYDTMTLLRSFDRLRPEFPTHARSNMPGKILLVSALEHVSRRPATLAWLIVSISNVGAVLLYLFIRDLFADRAVAYVSLILYLFVPAKLFFFPVLNTVTPVPILACCWLWLRALQSGQAAYAAGLGAGLYAVVFFDPLALVMGPLLVAVIPLVRSRTGLPWRVLIRLVGVTAGCFLLVYAGMRAWVHFDLLTTFATVASDAASFNAVAGRPYAIWVRQNIPDFLFGAGVCQAVLACLAIVYALYRAVVVGRRDPIALYCLSVGGVLVATDAIGVNRGEVVRLWIFLACFFQVPAAYVCARLNSRAAVALVLAPTLLQGIFGTGMFNFAQP